MGTSTDKWFVDQFLLRSPIEEFQEFSRLELERLGEETPQLNHSMHRRAEELVLGKLRREETGGGQ